MLDNHLQDLRDSYGADLFPKSARSYIDDWIKTKTGYLRKYLPKESDEPECDLQPEIEKVLRLEQERVPYSCLQAALMGFK